MVLKSLNGYTQETILDKEISIIQDDVSIAQILTDLEARLGFTTGYSNTSIDLSRKVSVNLENKKLSQVLRTLFPSKLFQFKVLGKKLLIYKRLQKYTISGYVSEKGSEEYLSNVSIYIKEQKAGTITNDYGFFSLSIPEGEHKLLISFIGYKSLEKNIDLTADRALNFNLELDTQYLDEIIISSDQEAQKSQVTQMSSERINPSVIADVPTILGEKDAIKTLQLLPGVQAGNEGSAGFYVRGGTPDQNLIVLDEATVYNTNHLFGIFSIFNGDAIKSVEMFKGGFPARFGGRLSSVVKIDTKNGNKEKFAGKANISLISSSFLLEGPIKKEKTSFVVSGRRTYVDLLLRPLMTNDDRFGYHFTDVNTKLHHVFNDEDKLYWSVYYGKDKFSSRYTFESEEVKQKIQWGNITSTLRWNHEFNNKLFSNTSLIFSNYKFTIGESNTVANTSSVLDTSSGIDDYGVKLDFNYYPNPDHILKFGLISTYHNFTPKAIIIETSDESDITNTQKIRTLESGLYIEDDWRVNDQFSVYPGLRLSHFKHRSKEYFKPELRFSMAYRIRPSLAIKASYAKMNQYIHRLSSSGLGLPTDLWISSTDRLKPQLSEQFALGLAKDFGDDVYEVTLESYYKKMDDIIDFKEGASFARLDGIRDVTNSIQGVDFVNGITTGQGWAYGTEFLLRKKRGKLTGWLGYTLSWSQRQFEELNQGRKFNDRYDRRHDASVVMIYKPNKKITLSGNWQFSSGINFNIPNTIGVNPENYFPIEPGISGPETLFNIDKNNFKGEDFHRLVLGVQFHKITKRNRERTWGFSFYNVYSRKNVFYYEVRNFEDSSENGLFKSFLLQFIPSFNYNLKF